MNEIKEFPHNKGQMPSDTAGPQSTAVRRLRMIRKISWVLALVATMVFAGYASWQTFGTQQRVPTAKEVSQSLIKSEFELVDHRGRKVTEKDYLGKWQLVFFGFTYCPDVCPTTLATVSEAMDILGEDADKVTPIFITVDPERDTPKVLAEYVTAFHPSLVGLTGNAEQIKSAAEAFRVYYAKAPQESASEEYLMGHSSFVYLMTPEGVFETHFSHERGTPEGIAAAVRERL